MAYERGESMALGVAVETTRGTFVTAQDYVRMREPDTIMMIVDETDIKESRPTGLSRDSKVITMRRVEGDISLNLRFRTIGYFFKSILGGWSSATESGQSVVYRHTGTLNANVLQPTLSLSKARGSYPHKQIPGAVVTRLSLSAGTDDVITGSVSIKGLTEITVANFTPAFASTDYLAPHQMITVKVAANTAGLSGATASVLKKIDIEFDRPNDERVNISSISPVDFVAKLMNISGSFVMDKTDDTFKDLAELNTPRAISITITNTAQVIGAATNPQLVITLPNVTIRRSETRPMDAIITEEITFEANYDDTAASGVTVSLLNEKLNYN